MYCYVFCLVLSGLRRNCPSGLLLLLPAFPSYISGVHHFGEIFAHMTAFTIEIVTFCPHGWCMLDMFLLPAFTHLGHECQDLLSPYDVCTD